MKHYNEEKLRKDVDGLYDIMLQDLATGEVTPEEAFYKVVLALLESSERALENVHRISYRNGYDQGAQDALNNASELLTSLAEDLQDLPPQCECEDSCATGECDEDF